MDKAFEIQRQARDNVKAMQTYLTDLQNWETEMKRKEAAINGVFEQDLPPVRSKIKKERPTQVAKKPEKRIAASDYKAWDKFDVDKACEDIDMEDVGPVSLDSKKSQQQKTEKLREEAQYEKERGNGFVKNEKWDKAIACYNRAIELVQDDAIYYANRGLCYLKKECLHQAETDCTEALRLDPTYVKALQRRAAARERLGSLRAASRDLAAVLRLEPHNAAARRTLQLLTARMGTKGSKSKSSPSSTPTVESKPLFESTITPQPKILELPDEPKPNIVEVVDSNEQWKNGTADGISVIRPVKKPPHLRSKRALKSIQIQEIKLGKTSPEKPPTRMKIIEIEEDHSKGDTNNNDSNKIEEMSPVTKMAADKGAGDVITSPESVKLVSEELVKEKMDRLQSVVPPVNSVQFMAEWKDLKDIEGARGEYLRRIDPDQLPSIFANALESETLSGVLRALLTSRSALRVRSYLRALTRVKRFATLAMFLTAEDKLVLKELLEHCKKVENCSEEDIADLKNKYEL